MSRVRAELSRMDEEVKKARREREQRVRQEMLAKMINARKLCASLPQPRSNHLPYPQSRLPPAAPLQPKSESVSEVLDLTVSPCPSPDIKPAGSDARIGLNGVSLNGGIAGGKGRPSVVAPETFDLEDLISQERQRQVPMSASTRVSPASRAALGVLRQQQHVHTLKQNHSALGVLTQQQSGSHAQRSAQGSARYSALLSQLQGGQNKTLMMRLLTQMQQQQQSSVSSPSTRTPLPPLQQQNQHANLLTRMSNAHSLAAHPQVMKRPAQVHAAENMQLPLSRPMQPMQSQLLHSQPAPERAANPSSEFDFDDLDFSCPSPVSRLQYPFTSQAPSSSTPPPSYSSSSLFASAPLNSSLSDSSSSSSHFTPSSSSSEQSHLLLPNGHCSMDALDVRETLDRMIRGTPPDHRQSVIQFNSVDWDAT